MKILIKTLVVTVVISLMPIVISELAPEYDGFNLEAADDKKKEQSTIRVDLNRLDALVNLVGELVIDRTRFVTIEEELRTNHPDVKLSGNISPGIEPWAANVFTEQSAKGTFIRKNPTLLKVLNII